MTTEDYVSFETAKLLKEKGFDAECDYLYVDGQLVRAQGCACNWNSGETLFTDYKNECSAPTLQMAMKWLREKHNLHIEIRITNHSMSDMINLVKYYWVIANTETGRWRDESTIYTVKAFDKSEEACEDAIKHCLKNLV